MILSSRVCGRRRTYNTLQRYLKSALILQSNHRLGTSFIVTGHNYHLGEVLGHVQNSVTGEDPSCLKSPLLHTAWSHWSLPTYFFYHRAPAGTQLGWCQGQSCCARCSGASGLVEIFGRAFSEKKRIYFLWKFNLRSSFGKTTKQFLNYFKYFIFIFKEKWPTNCQFWNEGHWWPTKMIKDICKQNKASEGRLL